MLIDFIPEILDEHPSTVLSEVLPPATGPLWVHLSTGSEKRQSNRQSTTPAFSISKNVYFINFYSIKNKVRVLESYSEGME